MSDLILLPNAEQIVSTYLRSCADIEDLVGDRVWTELPVLRKGTDEWRFPAVRVTRFGGTPLFPRPLIVDKPLLQIDSWGGSKSTALLVAETCRALLAIADQAEHADGVVFYTPDFGPLSYLPDDDFTPAKPRYSFDVSPTLRATRAPGS